MNNYDIIVLGLGAHGSSTLWHLSRSDKRVLGIDRFQPPHNHGSSHGESRIIRQAYHENPLYVPLVKAAYPIWAELETIANKKLFIKTGGLLLGSEDSLVVTGAKRSAETHGIPFEWLDAPAIHKRFPAFRPQPATVAVLEQEAGILFPEQCINAFLTAAANNGASIHTNEQVQKITPNTRSITVTTAKATYQTEKLIVSAGAWLNTLLPDLRLPLTIARQPLFWFNSADPATRSRFEPASMPIFIWEYEKEKMFYGFPALTKGIKIAPHHRGRTILPDDLQQNVTKDEIKDIAAIAKTYLTLDPVFHEAAVCMYTNTPDEDFILDAYPQYPNILIASPCSGHGFKFSSIIGRILADLALDEKTAFDLTPFSIRRPAILAPN